MDLLYEEVTVGVMNETEADAFIGEEIAKGSRLPSMSIANYRKMNEKEMLKSATTICQQRPAWYED